jgi:hypothetical protein
MQHLASILLVLSAIISSIAISLPIWASKDGKKSALFKGGDSITGNMSVGLFGGCASIDSAPAKGAPKSDTAQHVTLCGEYSKNGIGDQKTLQSPKDIIISQVFAVAGAILALGGAALCMTGHKTGSKIAGGLALACMVVVLVVFPLVSLNDVNKKIDRINTGSLHSHDMNLSVSWYMQLVAALLAVGGLVSCYMKGGKKSKRK